MTFAVITLGYGQVIYSIKMFWEHSGNKQPLCLFWLLQLLSPSSADFSFLSCCTCKDTNVLQWFGWLVNVSTHFNFVFCYCGLRFHTRNFVLDLNRMRDLACIFRNLSWKSFFSFPLLYIRMICNNISLIYLHSWRASSNF